MKTLIFIHGGESFKTNEEYGRFLYDVYIDWQSEPWSPPEEKIVWRDVIAKKWYTQGNQVFMPVFPNKLNARYVEWKIVFEGVLSKLSREDEVTFVGGSLGGCFLLKYFSEVANFPYTINQVHLIAACLECGDFTPPSNYEYLAHLGDRVHIWHAEDDMVVPFDVAKTLEKELPEAETHFFSAEKGYGHFHGVERIPELEVAIF